MSMDFDMEDVPLKQLQDDGLSANECYPQIKDPNNPSNFLVNDPTFALLNNDNYFQLNARANPPAFWKADPPASIVGNQQPPFRRRSLDRAVSEYEYAVDTGNSTRHLTPDEMESLLAFEEHVKMLDEAHSEQEKAYVDCDGNYCATEATPVKKRTSMLLAPTRTAPSTIVATPTSTEIPAELRAVEAIYPGGVAGPFGPIVTALS